MIPTWPTDEIGRFLGFRQERDDEIRLTIRPELMNMGGLLSGPVTFALIDYCMGSALWHRTTEEEGIATINVAINYVQTAREGELVCTARLDRRNRRSAVLRAEVVHEDGRLIATAVGSYTIFPRKRPASPAPAPHEA